MKLKKVSLLIVVAIVGVGFYKAAPSLFAQTISKKDQSQVEVEARVPKQVSVNAQMIASAKPTDAGVTNSNQVVKTEQPQVQIPASKEQSSEMPTTTTDSKKEATYAKVVADTGVTPVVEATSEVQTPESTKEQMLQVILNKAGISNQTELTIIDEGIVGDTFQVSIRGNSTDPQILSLVGIYRYDTQTGTVSKQDYLTGEFHTL